MTLQRTISRTINQPGKHQAWLRKKELGDIIIETRVAALEDPDLTDGAKVLFDYLLHLALQPKSQHWFGVVTISTGKLAWKLKRAKRSIYNWNDELRAKRFIRISKLERPNMWPINTYHIVALTPPEKTGQMLSGDGMWGNGSRRAGVIPGLGARKAKVVHNLHAENGDGKESNTPYCPENAPASGKEGHLPAAKFATARRKLCDCPPQNLRLGVAKLATGSRKKGHAAVAKNDTREPQKTTHYKESLETSNKSSEKVDNGEGESPPSKKDSKKQITGLESWKMRVEALFPSKLEKLLAELEAEKGKIKADKASFDYENSPLKPAKAEWVGFARAEIDRSSPLAADRKQQIREILSDPASYTTINYTQDAADRLDMLNKKIAHLVECLKGPAK